MSQLVAYYDETPVGLKGHVEIEQASIASAAGVRSAEGAVRTSLVYVRVPSEAGPFLVPFGEYDAWSLRDSTTSDQDHEHIRRLPRSHARPLARWRFGAESAPRFGVAVASSPNNALRTADSTFVTPGPAARPRDPRPLRWPDEPGFAAAVSSGLKNGASEVVINIRSNRTHAVDGSLGIELKKLGFDLGGGAERSGTTSLHIRAGFPESRKGWR